MLEKFLRGIRAFRKLGPFKEGWLREREEFGRSGRRLEKILERF